MFSSCKDSISETIDHDSGPLPTNEYEALSQTLQQVDMRLKSQRYAMDVFMSKIAQLNNPNSTQVHTIFTQNSFLDRFFIGNKNARTSGAELNIDEVNKEINSSNISKAVRKKILNFGKELEKVKEKASKKNIETDKEVFDKITDLEKDTEKATDLTQEEKAMFSGVIQVLKNNYQDIKRQAEQNLRNGKTSCWLCSLVNVIVTVIIVAVVVAVVVIAIGAVAIVAVTSSAITGQDAQALAAVGAGIGLLGGLAVVLNGYCFVVVDYGQQVPSSQGNIFGFIELNNC
ncbi:MAG: hypothetical protein EAZ32_18760 [Cytophagia bacterium]|nr:MAG: hypothetical protein EAZ38_01400 [Cytophagales bacterium]TAG35148.1 MAG: hypothetical protein EAZ32_18760 [Cytophagia bacterium]TAG77081.1 MAG: hypothetical protein EAZ22_16480 [Cytophagales bacterium]